MMLVAISGSCLYQNSFLPHYLIIPRVLDFQTVLTVKSIQFFIKMIKSMMYWSSFLKIATCSVGVNVWMLRSRRLSATRPSAQNAQSLSWRHVRGVNGSLLVLEYKATCVIIGWTLVWKTRKCHVVWQLLGKCLGKILSGKLLTSCFGQCQSLIA